LVGAIPKQLLSAEEKKLLEAVGKTINSSTSSMFWIYLALSLFFSFSLGMLWGTF